MDEFIRELRSECCIPTYPTFYAEQFYSCVHGKDELEHTLLINLIKGKSVIVPGFVYRGNNFREYFLRTNTTTTTQTIRVSLKGDCNCDGERGFSVTDECAKEFEYQNIYSLLTPEYIQRLFPRYLGETKFNIVEGSMKPLSNVDVVFTMDVCIYTPIEGNDIHMRYKDTIVGCFKLQVEELKYHTMTALDAYITSLE
jgi:hypothetical protein